MTTLKEQVITAVDALADELLDVSHQIHGHPELAFNEHFASTLLTDTLERHGLTPNRGCYGLATAFEASFGVGPEVAILAEYDALPGIGHACGHNLIATAALGATLALQQVASELPHGTIRIVGTPAEEKGAGKELMARQGAFSTTRAALMMHPAGFNLATMPSLCIAEVRAEFHGTAAHAAAMPHRGVNALDALLLAYQGISNLRQHIRPSERIHGIITDGGQAPNIVPDFAAGDFYLRAASEQALADLKPRVQACFEAGATASGARAAIQWSDVDYLDLNTNWPLAESFQRNAESIGREFVAMDKLAKGAAGSTDMGNVSYRVPSIHPMLACAPPHVVIHNPEFARWAGGDQGDLAALDGARALAMTAIDYLGDADLQAASRRAFDISLGLKA